MLYNKYMIKNYIHLLYSLSEQAMNHFAGNIYVGITDALYACFRFYFAFLPTDRFKKMQQLVSVSEFTRAHLCSAD